MIVTENLSKKFDNFLAVCNVNLQVSAGEVLALLGPNGAGKTTTVRMLTSVLRPSWGTATVAGYDVVKQATQVRASVGVLTEQHGLYNRMRAGEYLDFFGKIYQLSRQQRSKRIEELLYKFGLEASYNQRIGEFSKGMRQKLALARALLHDPPVLLLDEPTSAMDPESARLVRDSIRALKSDKRAIIICTHNLGEAEELADKIAIIRRGKIIIQGSPELLKRELLGPSVFKVELAKNLDGIIPTLPEDVTLLDRGEHWLSYSTTNPHEVNPQLLQMLLSQGFPVIALHEMHKNLEQVYLQAINAPDDVEVTDVA